MFNKRRDQVWPQTKIRLDKILSDIDSRIYWKQKNQLNFDQKRDQFKLNQDLDINKKLKKKNHQHMIRNK